MYFKKRSGVILVVFFIIIIVSSILLFGKNGQGITGAVIGIKTDIAGCGALGPAGTYDIVNNISSGDTCLTVSASNTIINCHGFAINHSKTVSGYGITSTDFNNVVIKNCIIQSSIADAAARDISLAGSTGSVIENNTFNQRGGVGIVLTGSDNNRIANNTFTRLMTESAPTSTAMGISLLNSIIGDPSSGNLLINNNFTVDGPYTIEHRGGQNNSLIYNTTFGYLNWTKTNITTGVNLSLGLNVYVDDNLTGFANLPSTTSSDQAFNLNASAYVGIRNLPYQKTPALFRNGARCDGSGAGSYCSNIVYDSSAGFVTFDVTSFSNYSTQEQDPPNASFITPTNGSNFSAETVGFNLSILDNVTHVQTGLLMFNTNVTPFNKTLTNNSGNWSATVNFSDFPEGLHTVTAYANDTLGNVNNTVSISFFVDKIAPNVSFLTPTNASNFSAETIGFNLSILFNITEVQTALLMFNTNVTAFNKTLTNNSGNWSATVNFSDFPEGLHSSVAYVNDSAGNINNTVNISFIVDRTAPNVSFITPVNYSNFSAKTVGFNLSILDNITQIQTALLMFNTNATAFNKTLTNNSGNWSAIVNFSDFPEGLHSSVAYVNDSAGNVNNTVNISFIVDRTAPTITFTSPEALSTISGSQSFIAVVVDNVTAVNTVIFQFSNGTTPFNRTASNSSGRWNVSMDTTAIGEGVLTVTLFANDTVSNMNNTETLRVTVDNVAEQNLGGSTGTSSSTSTRTTRGEGTTAATGETGEAAAAPTGEAATATSRETSGAFQSRDASASVSSTGAAAAATGGTTVQDYKVTIVNNYNKDLVLSAALVEKEQGVQLEYEENAKKRLQEELGEIDGAALEEELKKLKLLETVEILQAHKKLSHFLPGFLVDKAVTPALAPSGKRINGNLLKDVVLNAEELENIVVKPGETIEKEVKVRRGLRLDEQKEPPRIIFSSGGEQVLIKDIENHEELITGTAIDVDPKTKKLDYYMIFAPRSNGAGKETFTVELNINTKKPKSISELPLKSKIPFFFTGSSENIHNELLGPYTVNMEKGALIATQYNTNLPPEYEVHTKIFNKNGAVVAENKFDVKT